MTDIFKFYFQFQFIFLLGKKTKKQKMKIFYKSEYNYIRLQEDYDRGKRSAIFKIYF